MLFILVEVGALKIAEPAPEETDKERIQLHTHIHKYLYFFVCYFYICLLACIVRNTNAQNTGKKKEEEEKYVKGGGEEENTYNTDVKNGYCLSKAHQKRSSAQTILVHFN